jgi:hypothetical protein
MVVGTVSRSTYMLLERQEMPVLFPDQLRDSISSNCTRGRDGVFRCILS